MDNACTVNKDNYVSIPIIKQYNLKHDLFNPIQNSPPSVWKERLLKRIYKEVILKNENKN